MTRRTFLRLVLIGFASGLMDRASDDEEGEL